MSENVAAAARALAQLQPLALLAGAATIALAIAARPLNRLVPAMLVAVVGGTLVAQGAAALWPGAPALPTVSALPGALPPLSLPDLSPDTLRLLFGATLVMTLLALTEASAIARSVARVRGDKLDGNQEFIGQGLANLAGSFFSAYPASGSFNRSGVNVASGARTPLSAISAAMFLVLILSFVGPLARFLPLAVISGLLMVVAWGLIDRREIVHLWHEGARERVPLVVTALATVTLSLEWAILLGIASALLMHSLKRKAP
jgi:SulP family sulfate permease